MFRENHGKEVNVKRVDAQFERSKLFGQLRPNLRRDLEYLRVHGIADLKFSNSPSASEK